MSVKGEEAEKMNRSNDCRRDRTGCGEIWERKLGLGTDLGFTSGEWGFWGRGRVSTRVRLVLSAGRAGPHRQPFCTINLTNERVYQISNKCSKGEKRQPPMV